MNRPHFKKRTFVETLDLLCRGHGGDFYKHGRINQTAVAKAAGTTQPTVSRWMSGLHIPDTAQLEKLAKVFRVNLGQLTGDQPIPKIDSAALIDGTNESLKLVGEKISDFTQAELAELMLQIEIIQRRKRGDL